MSWGGERPGAEEKAAPVWEQGLRGPGDWREGAAAGPSWGSEVSEGLVGRSRLRNEVEFTGSPRCAGRWNALPAGDAASGCFEKRKAGAVRTTLARVSPKFGAEVFLRNLSPGIATVTSLGWLIPSQLLPEERFLARWGSKKPNPLVLDPCPAFEIDFFSGCVSRVYFLVLANTWKRETSLMGESGAFLRTRSALFMFPKLPLMESYCGWSTGLFPALSACRPCA